MAGRVRLDRVSRSGRGSSDELAGEHRIGNGFLDSGRIGGGGARSERAGCGCAKQSECFCFHGIMV